MYIPTGMYVSSVRVPRGWFVTFARLLAVSALGILSTRPAQAQPSRAADTTPARPTPDRAAPGRAAPDRARIDVLVLEDPSTDWGRRVRGQLSDLPASTRVRALPTLEQRRHSTDDAITAPSTALTAWLTTAPDRESSGSEGTFIAIWFAGAPRPSTRRIAGAWKTLGAADRSAVLELAALGVRSAVRSLLLDRATRQSPSIPPASRRSQGAGTTTANSTTAGSTTADTAIADRSTAAPATEDSALADTATAGTTTRDGAPLDEPAPKPSSRDAPFPLHFGLELGAAWQFYGRTAPGDPGLRAGLSLAGEAWSIALIGHYGFPMSARLGPAAFDLQRHALLAEVAVVVHELGAWRFSPLARAGVGWLRRDDTRGGSADATLDTTQSAEYRLPFFGLGLLAELRLTEALSLSLRGVLNVETAIPIFTLVDADGASVSSASPWNVQPSIELGARWRW
jgi:hypothetical protein